MRIFSARYVMQFSGKTPRGFEPCKSYSGSAILTHTPGTRTNIEKLFMNMYRVFYFSSSYLFSILNRATWYQIKAEGKPVNLV